MPRATIGVFTRDRKGDLHFRGMRQDDDFIDLDNSLRYENVYRASALSDSGGPVMRQVIDKFGVKRHVLVAVISSGYGIKEIWNKDVVPPPYATMQTKCVGQVTKVSKEVVKWINEVETGNYDTGKKE